MSLKKEKVKISYEKSDTIFEIGVYPVKSISPLQM